MLANGVPWQQILGAVFERLLLLIIGLSFSLVSSYFNWLPIFTILPLVVGFWIIVTIMPMLLNLSRGFFNFVMGLLLIHISITIVAFALHYQASGIIISGQTIMPEFWDAIYFSITTFSTLGYGDMQPAEAHRLLTSVEALMGMTTMAIGASMIWMWCQENIIPKEQALFDGNRKHRRKCMTTNRLRVRTILGRKKKLMDWVSAVKPTDICFYDEEKKEWMATSDPNEIPPDLMMHMKKSLEDSKEKLKNPSNINYKGELTAFITYLREDYDTNQQLWENDNLSSFLDALAAWIKDSDGYYENIDEDASSINRWRFIADALAAAKVYE